MCVRAMVSRRISPLASCSAKDISSQVYAFPKWNERWHRNRERELKCRMEDSFRILLTSAAALAGIVGLILVLGRVLRHTSFVGRAPSGRLLVVKDTVALDARRRLHLVQHGERSVLLLTGGETDLVVGWLDEPKSP